MLNNIDPGQMVGTQIAKFTPQAYCSTGKIAN